MSKIVLCVDDSATMQQVADITFRGTDFQYVGARTYDEGLEKAKGQKPSVILADAQIAGKSGYDLCLALKSDPKTADIPVVILVGNSAPYDNAKGTQVGADANLPKPWDTQTMLEKIGEIAGKGVVAKPGVSSAPASVVAPLRSPPRRSSSRRRTPGWPPRCLRARLPSWGCPRSRCRVGSLPRSPRRLRRPPSWRSRRSPPVPRPGQRCGHPLLRLPRLRSLPPQRRSPFRLRRPQSAA